MTTHSHSLSSLYANSVECDAEAGCLLPVSLDTGAKVFPPHAQMLWSGFSRLSVIYSHCKQTGDFGGYNSIKVTEMEAGNVLSFI